MIELIRAALAYCKRRQLPFSRKLDFYTFHHWRWHGDHYVNGYPCDPCPNCGDEVMWYRESTWQYDANGQIEHGMSCERCNHVWNERTGEVWRQGMTFDALAEFWRGSFDPFDKFRQGQ